MWVISFSWLYVTAAALLQTGRGCREFRRRLSRADTIKDSSHLDLTCLTCCPLVGATGALRLEQTGSKTAYFLKLYPSLTTTCTDSPM